MKKYIKIFIPKFIWEKIEENPELKNILTNINWLFFDNVVLLLAFFVYSLSGSGKIWDVELCSGVCSIF